MNSDEIKLSVLMPMYNAGDYLCDALDSVLEQSLQEIAIVVVDDGSTDYSVEILDQYAAEDHRIIVVRRPNTGLVGALNDGLQHCPTDLVVRMDADDVMMPGRLEHQLNYMESHPGCVACGGNLRQMDPYGIELSETDYPLGHEAIIEGVLKGKAYLMHGCLIYRKQAVLACGGYRSKYEYVEDIDLYHRLMKQGEFANLPDVVLKVRQHPGSICSNRMSEQQERLIELMIETYTEMGKTESEARSDAEINLVRLRERDMRQTYENWALHAIQQKRLDIARKHAWSLMRMDAFSIKHWRILKWSYLG